MKVAPRSWLYVPGHRADLIAKAVASGADVVVVDLEDAVPAAAKEEARTAAVETLRGRSHADRGAEPELWVRVNRLGSAEWEADCAALSSVRPDGLRLPGCESAELIRETAARVPVPLQLLVETARGLHRIDELATASSAVAGIGLGEADLAADLGVADAGLDWARGRVVLAARAAGLPAPVQSVWTAVSDTDGLLTSTRRGLALGFFGRSVIHPNQVSVVHRACIPDEPDLEWARSVVAAAEAASDDGEVVARSARGDFVDPAVLRRARQVLARSQAHRTTNRSQSEPSEELD